MLSTQQPHIVEEAENAQEQDSTPKLSLDKVRVRRLVKVKAGIRTGFGSNRC